MHDQERTLVTNGAKGIGQCMQPCPKTLPSTLHLYMNAHVAHVMSSHKCYHEIVFQAGKKMSIEMRRSRCIRPKFQE